MDDRLKTKRVDIIAYALIAAAMLGLTISFVADAKKDPDDRTMKILAGLCSIGTCIAGAQLGVDVKEYNDIKKELAQRTNEKQK
jgi:hypothetical protein